MSTQNSENFTSLETKILTNPKLDMPIEALLQRTFRAAVGRSATTRRLDQLLLRMGLLTIDLGKVVH